MDLKWNDLVFFGSYPFDENGNKRDVHWTIVDENEDSFLLVSEDVIDVRPFDIWDPLKFEVDWENSEIRRWLNGEFFDSLLDEDEKSLVRLHEYKIQPNQMPLKPDFRKVFTDVTNLKEDSPAVGRKTSTLDRVSLLSWEEIQRFPLDAALEEKRRQEYSRLMRTCCDRDIDDVVLAKTNVVSYVSPYALGKMDRHRTRYVRPPYWLRSPGSTPHAMAFAFDGLANRLGREYNEVLGIRPIMWVSKEVIKKADEKILKRMMEEDRKKAEEQLRTRKRWWEN